MSAWRTFEIEKAAWYGLVTWKTMTDSTEA